MARSQPQRPDWEQVRRDYDSSDFDIARTTNHALSAAHALLSRHVPFDGYTDEPLPGVWVPPDRQGPTRFLARFFRSAEDGSSSALQHRHVGYWVFAETGSQTLWQSAGYSRHDRLVESWALLQDGRIARLSASVRFVNGHLREASGSAIDLYQGDSLLIFDRRERRTRDTNRTGGGSYEDNRFALYDSDQIITGRKGGGLKKRLNSLLKKHGIPPVQ